MKFSYLKLELFTVILSRSEKHIKICNLENYDGFDGSLFAVSRKYGSWFLELCYLKILPWRKT